MAALKDELVIFALAVAFWFAAAPAGLTRESSAAELIQNALPAKVTLQKAGKTELLSAVCAAVRENRKSGPAITMAAAAAQAKYAPDIVGSVLRCARRVDCEFVGAIVKAAVSAEPGAAAAISAAALGREPNCGEAVQASVRAALKGAEERARTSAPGSSEPVPSISPGAVADEGFDPHEELILVCDSGTQRAIRESLLSDFLHSHLEAKVGSCPPTPTPSPLPSHAPSPPPPRP